MDYTIRDIPPEVDREIQKLAKANGSSVNAFLVEKISQIAGKNGSRGDCKRDLSDLVGKHHFDKGFDEAMADFDKIDPELWK